MLHSNGNPSCSLQLVSSIGRERNRSLLGGFFNVYHSHGRGIVVPGLPAIERVCQALAEPQIQHLERQAGILAQQTRRKHQGWSNGIA